MGTRVALAGGCSFWIPAGLIVQSEGEAAFPGEPSLGAGTAILSVRKQQLPASECGFPAEGALAAPDWKAGKVPRGLNARLSSFERHLES